MIIPMFIFFPLLHHLALVAGRALGIVSLFPIVQEPGYTFDFSY